MIFGGGARELDAPANLAVHVHRHLDHVIHREGFLVAGPIRRCQSERDGDSATGTVFNSSRNPDNSLRSLVPAYAMSTLLGEASLRAEAGAVRGGDGVQQFTNVWANARWTAPRQLAGLSGGRELLNTVPILAYDGRSSSLRQPRDAQRVRPRQTARARARSCLRRRARRVARQRHRVARVSATSARPLCPRAQHEGGGSAL